jgi:RNA polymerase sigma factor (sigma-70 family)
MQIKDDAQLLREYAFQGNEAAFGEIVARYTDLVYSTVLRESGCGDLAEDVAQSVFIDLARKAPSLAGRLKENDPIVGWIYRGTRHALSKRLRAEHRRHIRESQAMQEFDPVSTAETDWERLRPVLDKTLDELSEEDRQAMLLRFFQNQGFQAVGKALGISDDAAQKRVGRALEKLRARLSRQGITTTATLLSAVLSTNALQTAPAGLAARLAGASLAGAAASTGTTLTIMSLTSLKTGIIATSIAAALGVLLVAQHYSYRRLQGENAALRQQISQLGQPSPPTAVTQEADGDELERLRGEHGELLKLRGELGVLRDTMKKQQGELAAAQSEKAQLLTLSNTLDKVDWDSTRSNLNVLKHIGVACRIYAANNGGLLPTNFGQIQNELAENVEFPSGVGTNSFEFFDYGQPLTTNSPGYYFLAQESQALHYPNGKWVRVYLLADGSAQIASSEDGNFDAWQQQWLQRQAEEAAQQAQAPVSQ